MKKFLLFVLVGTLLACSSDKVSHIEITETVIDNTEMNKTVAEISLEGMSCVHMCGGLIKKNVLAIPGVTNVEFDFDEDRAIDVAKLSVDKNVDLKTVFAKIESLNEGQFTIEKCDVKKWVTKEDDHRIGSLPIAIPNVFQVLSFVLKHK